MTGTADSSGWDSHTSDGQRREQVVVTDDGVEGVVRRVIRRSLQAHAGHGVDAELLEEST